MKIESNSFGQLPFSKLFLDYIAGEKEITQFFNYKYPDEETLQQFAETHEFAGDRQQIFKLIKDYNLRFDVGETTLQEIEKLLNPESLVVVTGQQVTLFGGPLYTIYKTLTTIIYARKLSEASGRPVIPVFWLADEDHDLDEVMTLNLPGESEISTSSYNHTFTDTAPAVGSVLLGEEFEKFRKAISEQLDDTDFSDQLWSEIRKCYHKKDSFAAGFGRWLIRLFGKEGLILAGSNHSKIKKYSKSILKTSVSNQKEITNTLDEATYRLIEEGYHGQVQVQPSNLFYYNDEGLRQKIQYLNNVWSIPGKEWKSNELINEIDETPEKFSPNVFLRPIFQEHLLPVAAIVAGPGEIAYYAQMKVFYRIFEKEMPVIIPRFSITLVESAIDRILGKLPFEWTEYQQRIEDLEKRYVEESEEADIEKIFRIWKSHIEELSRAKKNEISKIDSSLAASVGKAKAIYFSELDKLKGKVYRSVKEQEKIQLDRILRIKQNFFPNGNLQEREIAFIYFMNKYGFGIWDDVLDQLKNEVPFSHKRIHL